MKHMRNKVSLKTKVHMFENENRNKQQQNPFSNVYEKEVYKHDI